MVLYFCGKSKNKMLRGAMVQWCATLSFPDFG